MIAMTAVQAAIQAKVMRGDMMQIRVQDADYRDDVIESLKKCIESLKLVIQCREAEIQRLRDEIINAASISGPRQVTVTYNWDDIG